MANYYAKFRSNYFNVKDRDAFIAWTATLPGLEPVFRTGAFQQNTATLLCDGSMPVQNGDDEEISLTDELATHLQDDQVAILMEVGSEGMRYFCGFTIAVNAKGKTIHLSLDDIYSKTIKTFGLAATRAQY